MTSVFKDTGDLPFINKRSEANIRKASHLLYLLVGAVFVMSCVLYYTVDTLKRPLTSISATPVPGAPCKMLTKVTTTTPLDISHTLFAPCGIDASKVSDLDLVQNGFFASHANFQVVSVNVTQTVADYPSTRRWDYTTSTGTGGIVTLKLFTLLVTYDVASCPYTPESLTTLIKTKVPNINELICKPWENNPPFECTTFETLSFFSILSQSFAITSGIFTILTITMKYVLETSWWYESDEDAATAMLTKEDVDSDTGAGTAMLTKEKADNNAGTGTAVVAKEKVDTWVDNPGNAL